MLKIIKEVVLCLLVLYIMIYSVNVAIRLPTYIEIKERCLDEGLDRVICTEYARRKAGK